MTIADYPNMFTMTRSKKTTSIKDHSTTIIFRKIYSKFHMWKPVEGWGIEKMALLKIFNSYTKKKKGKEESR